MVRDPVLLLFLSLLLFSFWWGRLILAAASSATLRLGVATVLMTRPPLLLAPIRVLVVASFEDPGELRPREPPP
jgi:hypothetical protein